MKICKAGLHEYDGDLHSRCPECKKLADHRLYERKAGSIAEEKKFAKAAPAKIAALESDKAALKREVAHLKRRLTEKVR